MYPNSSTNACLDPSSHELQSWHAVTKIKILSAPSLQSPMLVPDVPLIWASMNLVLQILVIFVYQLVPRKLSFFNLLALILWTCQSKHVINGSGPDLKWTKFTAPSILTKSSTPNPFITLTKSFLAVLSTPALQGCALLQHRRSNLHTYIVSLPQFRLNAPYSPWAGWRQK